MLINSAQEGECRIAVLEGDALDELHVERESSHSLVGNVYAGEVVRVEPSFQAAFVDIAEERSGFLHVSDVLPSLGGGKPRKRGPAGAGRPPIQELLSEGDRVLVQVTKDEIGDKAAVLTTYLAIVGRYLILLPFLRKAGVSKRISDQAEREELRRKVADLDLPEGMGYIVRTAGKDETKANLERDCDYLLKVWNMLRERFASQKRPGMLYREEDLMICTLRDIYSPDIREIFIDSEDLYRKAREFMGVISPRSVGRVRHYTGKEPLFFRFDVEKKIEEIFERVVRLPSGGSIVIDQTEALVAIDVNSGRCTDQKDVELTALKTNLEAAVEIARQVRLRDLGGVIINDFIDMDDAASRRNLETTFRTEMKKDRSRTRIGKISQFGIIEMTRQRMGPSLQSYTHQVCPTCKGHGMIKSAESIHLLAMRLLASGVKTKAVRRALVRAHPDVGQTLQNVKRREILGIEESSGIRVEVHSAPELPVDRVTVEFYNGSDHKLFEKKG